MTTSFHIICNEGKISIDSHLVDYCHLLELFIKDTNSNTIEIKEFDCEDLLITFKLLDDIITLDFDPSDKVKFYHIYHPILTLIEFKLSNYKGSTLFDICTIANYLQCDVLINTVFLEISNRIKYLINLRYAFRYGTDQLIRVLARDLAEEFRFLNPSNIEDLYEFIPERRLESLRRRYRALMHNMLVIKPKYFAKDFINDKRKYVIPCDLIRKLTTRFLAAFEAIIFIQSEESLKICFTRLQLQNIIISEDRERISLMDDFSEVFIKFYREEDFDSLDELFENLSNEAKESVASVLYKEMIKNPKKIDAATYYRVMNSLPEKNTRLI